MKKHLFLSISFAFLLYACKNQGEKAVSETSVIDPITSHIDSTISAGENFFMFANNGWFKKHPIPASERSNGIFQTIQDTINESVKKICESSAADAQANKGSNKQKIGDLYFSGMDTSSIEKANYSALNGEFSKIEAIKNVPDLLNVVSHLYKMNVQTMFGFGVSRDDKNSSKYIVYLGQAKLGLPERDYYFNTDSRTINIRNEYIKHLQKIFELTGTEKQLAEKNAATTMAIESALAKASRKMEDLRDPYKNYNKMAIASLNKSTPSINWAETLSLLGLKNIDSVVVGQPEFFTQLETSIKKISISDWKTYLKWTLINNYASAMNKSIEEQNFYFY